MDLKAKDLVRALLGNARLDPLSPPISASTFTAVLEQLGVAKSAVRAALNRMVEQGYLTAERSGRTVSYWITSSLREILEEARDRLFAEEPFASNGSGWTLVTVSIPEARRTHRHRMGAVLMWRGFAPLWNGLWIASGTQPVEDLMRELGERVEGGNFMAFEASKEHPRITIEHAVELWGLEKVCQAHKAFIDRWGRQGPASFSALAAHTWLIADWTRLIGLDPMLSMEHLPAGWPAGHSTEVFRRNLTRLYEQARDEFNSLEPEHRPTDS